MLAGLPGGSRGSPQEGSWKEAKQTCQNKNLGGLWAPPKKFGLFNIQSWDLSFSADARSLHLFIASEDHSSAD